MAPQRIKDKGQQHLPGEEARLIGEHRTSGEKKYYLANLPAATDLRTLAATIKARWICEQAHQQLKEELGLDHFEAGQFSMSPDTHRCDGEPDLASIAQASFTAWISALLVVRSSSVRWRKRGAS